MKLEKSSSENEKPENDNVDKETSENGKTEQDESEK